MSFWISNSRTTENYVKSEVYVLKMANKKI